jgi:hypothetical protein
MKTGWRHCTGLALLFITVFTPAFGVTPTLINFDSLTVPVNLGTQFVAQGVLFAGGLADNQTFGGQVIIPSAPNYVRFSDPFTVTFVDPSNSAVPATTDFVSYENIGLHSGGQFDGYTVSVRNAQDEEIATATVPPTGPGAEVTPFTTTFSIGGIHSLVFTRITNPNGSGTIGFDDLRFGALVPVASLASIRPNAGAQGKTLLVRLTGANLTTAGNTIQVSGNGVSVANAGVDSSPTNLTAKFVIDPSATPGPRNVTVTNSTGGSSSPQIFTVRSPDTPCAVSLPLTATGSRGNLNITAGIGTDRSMEGTWVVGRMVFNAKSVSFYGTTLLAGRLMQTNPPLIRSLSTNMAPVPAVAVVNAFYNPSLCAYSVAWTSTTFATVPYEPLSRSQIESFLNNVDLRDYDGAIREIPR